MKALKQVIIGAVSTIAITVAFAAGYVTFTGAGTTSAVAVVPHDALATPRVVNLIASSDLVTAVAKFYAGGGYATTVASPGTNAAATIIPVASTNGMSTNVWLIIEGTTPTFRQVAYATTNATVVLQTAVGSAVAAGNEIEVATLAQTIGIGSNDYKALAGDALYVGNGGRSIAVVVDGTTTCRVDSLVVKYD